MEFDVNSALEKAKSALNTVAKGTEKAVSIQKKKFDLYSLEGKLNSEYEALGRVFYDSVVGGSANEDNINAAVEVIRNRLEEIEEAKEVLAKEKNQRLCPTCGESVDKKAVFCSYCGERLIIESDREA